MMRFFSLIIPLGMVLLFSCQDKKSIVKDPPDINTVDSSKSKMVKKDSIIPITWESVNNDLDKKYQTRIEIDDIRKVYRLLVKEKLVANEDFIHDTRYPAFTHYSPTIMVEELTMSQMRSDRPKEMRVFTPFDRDFILSQQRLISTREFKWSSLTNNIANSDYYPRLEISIPVFSIDKNKFIVCIEKYKYKDCIIGISYLFVTTGNQTKIYEIEKVSNC